ncbi:MAG: hypothetical protein R3A44_34690 [Caldilineaceae bacterium]
MATRNDGLALVMALLFCIYTLTNSGGFHIIDEVSLFAVTESLALRGAVDTNAIAWTQFVNSPGEVLGAFGPDGQVYSKKGPAPSFAALPWYLLWRALAILGVAAPFVQVTLLWNGVITALTAGLLWLTARGLGYAEKVGAMLALLFGLCTIAWPYANHFFGEPLSALGLLLCFYGLHQWRTSSQLRWIWLAGVGAALVLATVAAHVLLIGIFGIYWLLIATRAFDPLPTSPFLRHTQEPRGRSHNPLPSSGGPRRGKHLMPLLLPVIAVGLLLMAYNMVRFGHPLDTGYHFDAGEGFTAAWSAGLWGLLVSPYRGLFWHTPLFLATLVAFPPFARRHKLEAIIIALLSLLLIGLYGKWWMWWGGFAWGPRFLVPLAPLWVLPLAECLNPREPQMGLWARMGRIIIIPAALLSLAVQLLSVLVNYVNYEIRLRDIFPTDWNDPLLFGPPAQQWRDWLYSPVLGQFYLLRENFVTNSDLAWLWPDGTMRWSVLAAGLFTIGGLMLLLARWQRQEHWVGAMAGFSFPVMSSIALPILLIGVWTAAVRDNPRYGVAGAGYRAIIDEICANRNVESTEDAMVTITPYSYQIPMNWLPTACRRGLPIYGYAQNSMDHTESAQVLDRVLHSTDRIWFVTDSLAPNAPENTVERWLAQHAYKAAERWYADYRLLRYGTPAALANIPNTPQTALLAQAASEGQIQFISQRIPGQARAGAILPMEWSYRLSSPIGAELHWFVQLLNTAGEVAAQLDIGPDQGYAIFSQLPSDTELTEHLGLDLPPSLPPGDYRLIAGLYDPTAAGAPRLHTPAGVDFVELSQVQVAAP